MNNIIPKLIGEINSCRIQEPINKEIYSNNNGKGINEMLFFIKPELTEQSVSLDFESIYQMIFSKIDEYDFHIKNIRIINASYLDKYDIIAKHYGVINTVSRDPKNTIGDAAKLEFKKSFNIEFDYANIIGSLELLSTLPGLQVEELHKIWTKNEMHKLGGGIYCAKCTINSSEYYVFNGFHPLQIKHFTAPGKVIVAITLTGNCSWSDARRNFIGSTNPENASNDSIRSILYSKMKDWRIPKISYSYNGAHLSAGPIEGLIELIRYNTVCTKNSVHKPVYDFQNQLQEEFGVEIFNKIMENPTIIYNENPTSVFDLTEEMNSDVAIETLKKVNWNQLSVRKKVKIES
ncbi:MAG: hypothetical protein MI922_29755 [Bacteroidales bacterium]|nr:hypothetical protein [Bacteroidales bacterium]